MQFKLRFHSFTNVDINQDQLNSMPNLSLNHERYFLSFIPIIQILLPRPSIPRIQKPFNNNRKNLWVLAMRMNNVWCLNPINKRQSRQFTTKTSLKIPKDYLFSKSSCMPLGCVRSDSSTWQEVPLREHTIICLSIESVMYRFLPSQSTASPSTMPTPAREKAEWG